MSKKRFGDLGLSEILCQCLSRRRHTYPTPIQQEAIPLLLQGRDLLGLAQTGTGKTGAFSLPILQMVSELKFRPRPKQPVALILAPTRELVIQIGSEIEAYKRGLPIRHTTIFGGVSQARQVEALGRGAHIVVATPGRLIDLKSQGHLTLSAVRFFVLDEADRMLDMGFIKDIRKILPVLPEKRQSLMFSATMPKEIDRLASDILFKPVRVEVAQQSRPVEKIEQYVCFLPTAEKRTQLENILSDPACERVIVFARMKHRTNRIAEQLCKAGISADAINGNKSQNARQKALERFKRSEIRVLVATDIAARGIDVREITHVINYELPNEPESYVHRIGRTARAGAVGRAISLCDPSELHYLRSIEKLIGDKIPELEAVPDAYSLPEMTEENPSGKKTPSRKKRKRKTSKVKQSRYQASGN